MHDVRRMYLAGAAPAVLALFLMSPQAAAPAALEIVVKRLDALEKGNDNLKEENEELRKRVNATTPKASAKVETSKSEPIHHPRWVSLPSSKPRISRWRSAALLVFAQPTVLKVKPQGSMSCSALVNIGISSPKEQHAVSCRPALGLHGSELLGRPAPYTPSRSKLSGSDLPRCAVLRSPQFG